ncbi:MAG: amidohydrolase family protein [Planctomycetes bacterium]|nr:amidohydrolase family protein [Planctomycetota bacterium]
MNRSDMRKAMPPNSAPLVVTAMRARLPMVLTLACLLAFGPAIRVAHAQELVLKDATILVGDGKTLDGAAVQIRGEKIVAVGKKVRGGMMSRAISLKGKYLTPGLIDVWGQRLVSSLPQGRPATAVAADAYDEFDHHAIDNAIRQGITTVYVPAPTAAGLGGIGSVVRLVEGAARSEYVLSEEAAICAALGGMPGTTAINRAKGAADFRKLWLDAKQYRKAFEGYDEDLKEYEEKIKKRADEDKGKEPKKPEEKAGGKTMAEDLEPPPNPRPPGRRPRREPPGQRPEPRPESDSKEKKVERKDDIKRPDEPGKDRAKDALLRAIDGKLIVRVQADRPDEILNAIDVAREFNLSMVIEGANGAVPVARELAAAEIPVILAAEPLPMQFLGGATRFASADAAARLAAAGVAVHVGSGAGAPQSPANLALSAARLVAQGIPEAVAFRMLTGDAAKLLALEDETGRIAGGLSADLVVWSHHPFDPAARVERVFIRGHEVYGWSVRC